MTSEREASIRERLVHAALDLFSDRGFAETTVEDITNRAGVGRTTFFRTFTSKEDAVFPDHDGLLARADARLATATAATGPVALYEATRLVLRHYVAEGEIARRRYRLVASVPALRARELAGLGAYQRLFGHHLTGWIGEPDDGALRAQLLAAGVVAAHNHVLRGWLREEEPDPEAALARAVDTALATFTPTATTRGDAEQESASVVVVVRSGEPSDLVAERIRRALT